MVYIEGTSVSNPSLFYLYGVTNLPLTSTLHSVMRYLIVSSFPLLTASPSGVSPSLVTAPIVVRVVEVYVIIRVVRINYICS